MACALALAAPSPSLAGAWPKAPGEGLLIVTTTLDRARLSFDADGQAADPVRFDKQEVSAYLEYGLGWGLTAVARAAGQDVMLETPAWRDAASGASATQLALRKALIQRDHDVLSIQGAVFLPGDVENANDLSLGDGDRDYEARLMYGRGFTALGGTGFAEAHAAWRWRSGAAPDEARAGLAGGVERGRWLAMGRVDLLAGSGARPPRRNYASLKVQASLARRLGGETRLEVGAFRTVAGRSIVRETAVFAAVWRAF